jgi:hypothetical protein
MARVVGGNTFFAKQTAINFTVRNLSNKTLRIFNTKILSGQTYDLMSIQGISEADIRQSLITGELMIKIRKGEINVVSSSIDLAQEDQSQRDFLEAAGVPIEDLTVGSSSPSIRIHEAHLESTVSITSVTSPPPAPFDLTGAYPFLTMTDTDIKSSRIKLEGSFSFSVAGDFSEEFAPLVLVKFFIDGVEVPFSASSMALIGSNSAALSNFEALNFSGAVSRVVSVTPGLHTFDLRCQMSGSEPNFSVNFAVTEGYDHATLIVTEC